MGDVALVCKHPLGAGREIPESILGAAGLRSTVSTRCQKQNSYGPTYLTLFLQRVCSPLCQKQAEAVFWAEDPAAAYGEFLSTCESSTWDFYGAGWE